MTYLAVATSVKYETWPDGITSGSSAGPRIGDAALHSEHALFHSMPLSRFLSVSVSLSLCICPSVSVAGQA